MHFADKKDLQHSALKNNFDKLSVPKNQFRCSEAGMRIYEQTELLTPSIVPVNKIKGFSYFRV